MNRISASALFPPSSAKGFRDSLQNLCAFSSRDWSENSEDAWIWGIVMGWDAASFRQLQQRFHWTDGEIKSLKAFHKQFKEGWG